MKVTVAICTWNRAKLLNRTLDSLALMTIPRGIDWELLVVDNNCSDETPTVIDSFVSKLPIKKLRETKQGHSHSRNCAVTHAESDFLIWTDDDVRVDREWLATYVEAFARDTECGYWGGRILPDFEVPPPRWVNANWRVFENIFVIRDLQGEATYVTPPEYPFGASLAVRTALQKEYQFRPEFGRVKDGLRGFDEIDFLQSLTNRGIRGKWLPTALLYHFVPRERMTEAFLGKFFRGQGETHAVRGKDYGTPAEIQKQLSKHRFWYRVWRTLRMSKRWVPSFIEASRLEGFVAASQRERAIGDSGASS